MALPRRLGADDHVHGSIGPNHHIGALVGGRTRRLDIVGDADPRQLAAMFRITSTRLEVIPVDDLERLLEVVGKGTTVVGEPKSGAIGQCGRTDEITTADLDPVQTNGLGPEVHEPLDDVGDLRSASTSIHRCRRRVGKRTPHPHVHCRDVVGRARHAE